MNKNRHLKKFINKKNNNINNDYNLNIYSGSSFKYHTSRSKKKKHVYRNPWLINTYSNKRKIMDYYRQKQIKSKIIPGMFSYKRASHNLSNSYDSKTTSKNNTSRISNKLNINNQNNQNHLLLANLKLLIDNTETISIRTLTSNNDNISNNFPSFSSLNLNKYKLTNDIVHKNRSLDMGNAFNNTNYNYDFLKYNNIIINNIQPTKIKSRSNEVMPIPFKNSSTNNYIQYNVQTEKYFKTKNYFSGKSKAENESRRMIIEYLKVLKQNEKNKLEINNILKNNNISYRVLNQQLTFNLKSLSNSFCSNFSKKIDPPKRKTNLRNINKFLNDMDDITKDKINMIKFLSVPRIMEIIFLDNKYKFIFMLVPNQFCYLRGIESYIFQWSDIKKRKVVGGFDLIKIESCCVNYQKNKNFFIETFNGKFHRQYELITPSNSIASYYVKSFNYLSRLEKCKIYNKKKNLCINSIYKYVNNMSFN